MNRQSKARVCSLTLPVLFSAACSAAPLDPGVSSTSRITGGSSDVGCAADEFAPPLVITKGGIYTGNWQSPDVDTPAILVATTDPVDIENTNLRGPGDLIASSVANTRITVRNTRGVSVNPNVAKRTKGSFLHLGDIASLVVEHCDIEATNYGVSANNFGGPTDGSGAVTIRYNVMHNMDGRYSDGSGGYDIDQRSGVGREYSHAIILAHFFGVPNVEIAWNRFENDPRDSSVDDVINMYSARGTPDSPILIHDNYLRGAYGSDPSINDYTGGGIITDGSGGDDAVTASAFVKIYANHIVNNANYGVQIGAGHDIEAYGNRTVSTGMLPDGTWMESVFGNGVVVWNGYNQPESIYFNNDAHDNVSGWVREQRSPQDASARVEPPIRVDYYTPACRPGGCGGNVSLPDPITSDVEAAELATWNAKLSAAGLEVGPPVCGTSPAPSVSSGPLVGIAGKCLDVRNDDSANGAVVQIYECNGTDAQKWTVTGTSGSPLVGPGGKCLDVSGGQSDNGTRVQLYECNGTSAQAWTYDGKRLVGIGGKCLDVPNSETENSTSLQIFDCNGTSAQTWTVP